MIKKLMCSKIDRHNLQKDSDKIRYFYLKMKRLTDEVPEFILPYFRRVLRFLALPYCYSRVNWRECTASHFQVIKDFLYIFVKLKYFPDNYSLCHLWEKDRAEWRYYYGSIYDAYQRGRLRKEVQKKEYEIIFNDKNVCYQLCKAAKLPLPNQYGCIEPSDKYKSMIRSVLNSNPKKELIIKPVLGQAGKDIFLIFKRDDNIFVKGEAGVVSLDNFVLSSYSVVQECIIQHGALSKISSSINTIRIVTLLTKEKKVIIVGALMRFGVGNAFIDNTSRGGVAIGINIETGTLKKTAFDFKSRIYTSHPTSNIVFEGFQIPHWHEIVKLTKRIQLTFPYYRLLGHDIGVTSKGPIIIEINAAHDNVGIEQSYGPILAKNEVRDEFKRYDLLINKLQRNLA